MAVCNSGFGVFSEKTTRKQPFKLRIDLTLDAIRNMNNTDLGGVIKESFLKFENTIKEYEKHGSLIDN